MCVVSYRKYMLLQFNKRCDSTTQYGFNNYNSMITLFKCDSGKHQTCHFIPPIYVNAIERTVYKGN